MDFEFTDDLLLIQETARDFAKKELAPHAARIDREESFPPEHLEKLAEIGFLGFLVVGLLLLSVLVVGLLRLRLATAGAWNAQKGRGGGGKHAVVLRVSA